MGRVRQISDNLHSSIPGPGQLAVFFTVQFPESGSIECCGVDIDQVDNDSWLIEAKLLQDLVHLVVENCSLSQNISFSLRREGGEAQLGRQQITKVLS